MAPSKRYHIHGFPKRPQNNDPIIIKYLQVNRTISQSMLIPQSPVFKAMFHSNFIEGRTRQVDFTKLFNSLKTFNKFINYLANNSIHVEECEISEMLYVAEQYFLERLKRLCARSLLSVLCPNNCLSIWFLSIIYRLPRLSFVCQSFCWQLIPFIIRDQSDVIICLPEWFVWTIISKLKHLSFHPRLLSKFLVTWISGNLPTCLSSVTELLVDINQRDLHEALVANSSLSNQDREIIYRFYCPIFLSPYYQQLRQTSGKDDNPRQYLSVVIEDKLKHRVSFFCMEGNIWVSKYLPPFNGKVLGIISQKLLVRVTRGSTANLFNLTNRNSYHTPCVLEAVHFYKNDIATFPTESSYFIFNSCLYVAIIGKERLHFKLIIFRYNAQCNAWRLVTRYDLPTCQYYLAVHTKSSTVGSKVYIVMKYLNLPCQFSQNDSCVYIVDMTRNLVVCTTLYNLGKWDDFFIENEKIYFIHDSSSIYMKNNISQLLKFNPSTSKYATVLYKFVGPYWKTLRVPSFRSSSRDSVMPLHALYESTACWLEFKPFNTYDFYINNFPNNQWVPMPPPPPIFKHLFSKLYFIHSYRPIYKIQNSFQNIINPNERYFKDINLSHIGPMI